ncbi:hypothetical protein BDQ12DRAFT_42994 [Crucibulum laeve]|uniref:Uncharacterized protein n=1 Tax=Crucibulum laeve TaxID=68775 RepID=A0A5C3MJ74_9AGAR|nr:hypothetical protein BDQ12DRAFT_42994 [Crucibulum laeve]
MLASQVILAALICSFSPVLASPIDANLQPVLASKNNMALSNVAYTNNAVAAAPEPQLQVQSQPESQTPIVANAASSMQFASFSVAVAAVGGVLASVL